MVPTPTVINGAYDMAAVCGVEISITGVTLLLLLPIAVKMVADLRGGCAHTGSEKCVRQL
jgi:hypothetical protein